MNPARVLVIGSGGREHAMAWRLALDSGVEKVFVAPGNAGMDGDLHKKVDCTGIAAGDFEEIARFVRQNGVSFVAVGPDQALADGAVDFLEARGIAAFGPTKAASRIEWSKAYSKELMNAAGIPTARFESFSSLSSAKEFLSAVEWGSGWVVKADGLALGKGVVVCDSREQGLAFCEELFSGKMGEAGKTVVIEERLAGREVSCFFLCDGERGAPLGMACDYKRILEGDKGPNTGGMGAFTPADWLPPGFMDQVGAKVTAPLLAEMKKRGNPFKGMLFVGLMVEGKELNERGERDSFKVLEFNARFGDPETQALLPMLGEDLLPWLRACRDGKLSSMDAPGPAMKAGAAVHVVSAAEGYPGTPLKGDEIHIDPAFNGSWEKEGVKLFFAGVSSQADKLFTNGGRVLGVTALGRNREEARAKAHAWTERVSFRGRQRRADVGR